MRVTSLLVLVGALLSCFLAAQASEFDDLISSLSQCTAKTTADIGCINKVSDRLQDASDYIQKVRDLKINMQRIYNGINAMKPVLSIGGKLPGVGPAIRALKIVVDRIKPVLKRGLDGVNTVDRKIYPMKPKADRGVEACDRAISPFALVKTVCQQGSRSLVSARDCVELMDDDSAVTTALEQNMESLGRSLNPGFTQLNDAFGLVDKACSEIEAITDVMATWPNIDGISRAINTMYRKLRPMLDFFTRLRRILGREVCASDAAKVFKSVAKKAADAAKKAAEAAKKAAKKVGRFFRRIRFGRRRRDLHVIRKRDVCISVQKVLDGADDLLDAILKPLNDLISNLVRSAPDFGLDGLLPNLNVLSTVNVGINLPSVDLKINLPLVRSFHPLTWTCAVQVEDICSAETGAVSFNCGQPLSAYRP